MKNFKVNEYFKDYVAVQKEYFSDLIQVTDPVEDCGKLVSAVLFNGEEYKKIEAYSDELVHILLVPIENLQTLPIVEFMADKNTINSRIYELIDKNILSHTSYTFSLNEKRDVACALLSKKCFDVSDEINNEKYILKYGMELELGKEITKKQISSEELIATRNDKNTEYWIVNNDNFSEPSLVSNDTSLFELLKNVSKEMIEKNKTK